LPDADYIDCDVEEPNGFLFLSPDLSLHDSVTVPVPEVDPALCRCAAPASGPVSSTRWPPSAAASGLP
jgi:MinD superfamily P-loop ATPase